MILAGFIADQRTTYRVSQAVACRALGVSESWFYKWRYHTPSSRDLRRVALDAAVKGFFDVSKGTYGGSRILADLRETPRMINPSRPRIEGEPGVLHYVDHVFERSEAANGAHPRWQHFRRGRHPGGSTHMVR
jgi:hypothetical protein